MLETPNIEENFALLDTPIYVIQSLNNYVIKSKNGEDLIRDPKS